MYLIAFSQSFELYVTALITDEDHEMQLKVCEKVGI